MSFKWLIPLLCRGALIRRAMQMSRRFRDVFTEAEIISIVDEAIARATLKFEAQIGPFRSFARTFVERAVLRAIAREVRWRGRICELDSHEVNDPASETADAEVRRSEVQLLLGSDYSTYFSHFAWQRSMRDISRAERRSIRSVQDSIARASRRLQERYGYESPRPGPTKGARGRGRGRK